MDGGSAVAALVATAAVLALVGFAKWAAARVGRFFDSDSGGWSTADQDAQGWWYEHNSDEPGVRYYHDGPLAGQRVVMDAAEDRAERNRLEAAAMVGAASAATASDDYDEERERERESIYEFAAVMYGNGGREEWESDDQYRQRMRDLGEAYLQLSPEDRAQFDREVRGSR